MPFLSKPPNAILKPGGPLKWKKRLVKDVRFSLQLTQTDKDLQAYISPFRHASSVITKAKAETWQATSSSLSPKFNPKSVYSLLHSVAVSSSSSPNFPNCSSSRESALVFSDYLRSHFSVSQPKALCSRARATFPSSAKPRALRSLTHSFASPSPLLNFLQLPLVSRPPPLAQTK